MNPNNYTKAQLIARLDESAEAHRTKNRQLHRQGIDIDLLSADNAVLKDENAGMRAIVKEYRTLLRETIEEYVGG